MPTSLMIHGATEVRAGSVMHSNSNAISLYISTNEGSFDVTLFNLPTDAADYLASALAPTWTRRQSEDEIRADERRKIADRLGVAA